MKLVGLNDLLPEAQSQRYAVGAYNYTNFESAMAIAETGCRLRSPVMYIIGPCEIPLLGVNAVVDIARYTASVSDVPVCLHLDHATDIKLVSDCIEAGFPSVMMDASQHSFEENIRLTRLVVQMAHAKGVTVEGELGAVGKVADHITEGAARSELTDPSKAAEFVERTGVDALAVAIGNAHGLYTQAPVLDFARLQDIRNCVSVPIVLHGGSGTPKDQLAQAIDIGISKVNVASELSKAFMTSLYDYYVTHDGKGWYAEALEGAKHAISSVVERWMKQLGSVNRCL